MNYNPSFTVIICRCFKKALYVYLLVGMVFSKIIDIIFTIIRFFF